jgi:hypothetical protein
MRTMTFLDALGALPSAEGVPLWTRRLRNTYVYRDVVSLCPDET